MCIRDSLKLSELLNPFLVLTGKSGKTKKGKPTLDEQYSDWATRTGGTCEVAFQKKHWFDTYITLRWLRWLKAQSPAGKKIGLIWDHAPAHDSDEVKKIPGWSAELVGCARAGSGCCVRAPSSDLAFLP